MKRIAAMVLVAALSACGGTQKPADTTAAGEVQQTEETTAEGTQETPADPMNTADPNAPSDVAAAPPNAEVTASGLAYRVLTEGSGDATPEATSTVRVHYTGWTTDGVKFDSSVDRGEPAEFPLNKVIAGWTEGVSMMKVGEKRRLWIPQELAYKGREGFPAGVLVFDVELLAIVE